VKTPARVATQAGFDPLEVWPFQDEDRHFCSGVNSPGEVNGLALSGRSIGITCTEIRAGLLEELELFAGGGLEVFVDSGAFSEVKFSAAGRTVVAPITAADWLERFEVYRFVAAAFRSRAFIVAPDAVGDQLETLARMERWGHVMRGLALHYGARVIVPVQKGELEPIEFLTRALLALRLPKDQIVIGIPSKKSATTPVELRTLAAELAANGVTAPFHLLGMGPKSKGWEPMRAAIRASMPEVAIYSDAVGVRGEVGRTNGPGGTPRRMTIAQDRARSRGLKGPAIKAAALTETGWEDSRRATQAARRAGWYDPELESSPGVPFVDEDGQPCLDYGPGGPFGDDASPQAELDLGEVAA
jgi:hypothetical protein